MLFGLALSLESEAERLCVPWANADCKEPSLVLPLELVKSTPAIRLNVGRHKDLLFVVDSGLEQSLLGADLIAQEKIGIEDARLATLYGVGDSTQTAGRTKKVSVKAGRVELASGHFFVTDLAAVRNAANAQIAGILGFDFLRAHVVIVDYRERRIILQTSFSPNAQTKADMIALKVAQSDKLPITVATFSVGGSSFTGKRVLIDTGLDRSAFVNDLFVRSRAIAFEIRWNHDWHLRRRWGGLRFLAGGFHVRQREPRAVWFLLGRA